MTEAGPRVPIGTGTVNWMADQVCPHADTSSDHEPADAATNERAYAPWPRSLHPHTHTHTHTKKESDGISRMRKSSACLGFACNEIATRKTVHRVAY